MGQFTLMQDHYTDIKWMPKLITICRWQKLFVFVKQGSIIGTAMKALQFLDFSTDRTVSFLLHKINAHHMVIELELYLLTIQITQ